MSRPLTTTSYAILGLLALRPWTTYELANQMERTIGRSWPRARSRLFDEPKKLVEHGLAKATEEPTGRRPRTVYKITAAGRRALAGWLAEPGAGPALEYEQLTKLFFADQGTKQDALATLEAARRWAEDEILVFADVARTYLDGGGPFPERLGTNLIGARFLVGFYDLIHRWATEAAEVVRTWPDDPKEAPTEWDVLEGFVRRGDEIRRARR